MKNWFISGISSGLGKALATSVMESGDFVIGTFRKQPQVDAFNKENSGKGFAVLLDVTNENQIEETVRNIIAEFGRIDVLVNNAGIGFVGAIEEASMKEIRKAFEVNFFGTLKLTQSVLPFMRKERKGHIVQISSHAGIKGFAGFGVYNASKFAVEGFSEALAQEVLPLGIKVTIIEPGPFRTNFAGNSLQVAEKVIYDYAATVGVFKTKIKSVDGKQEGSPAKASEAIIDVVNSSNNPLRLPLGKIALKTIQTKLDSVKEDLEQFREVAENVVYD